MKKLNGKRKERSLKTVDRKIAERRFKEWIDSEVEKTTLVQLLSCFEAVYRQGPEYAENNEYISRGSPNRSVHARRALQGSVNDEQ